MQKRSSQNLLAVTLIQYNSEGKEVKRIVRPKLQADFIVANSPGWVIDGGNSKVRQPPVVAPKSGDDGGIETERTRLSDISPQQAKNVLKVTMDAKVVQEGMNDARNTVKAAAKERAKELNLI